MTDINLEIRILQHCLNGSKPIISLIKEASSKTHLYRVIKRLIRNKWLESDRKDSYGTTEEGRLHMQSLLGESPEGLSLNYPPLRLLPTPQHKALVELILAAVIARRFDLRPDHHPTFVLAGPTLTWKTSTGRFLSIMLDFDPVRNIINMSVESRLSIWLRKTATGAVSYRRELLDSTLVIFDEAQKADKECRRHLDIWTSGTKRVAVENHEETIQPVSLIILNPKEGENLRDRLLMDEPQLRRSIICDLSKVKMPDLVTVGESIIEAARKQGPLKLSKPMHDCAHLRQNMRDLFTRTLSEEGQRLVDFETIFMLANAMTSFKEPLEAARLVFYDCLLLWETVGWTVPGWRAHVNSFPVSANDSAKNIKADTATVSNELWEKGFGLLHAGGSATELVTKLHAQPDVAENIVKVFNELKGQDAKMNPPKTDARAPQAQDKAPSTTEAIPVEKMAQAFKLLDSGQSPTDLVTTLGFTFEEALNCAKAHSDLKNLGSERLAPEESAVEKKDPDVEKLEHDIEVSLLERKKREIEAPLEADKRISTLTDALENSGKWKQDHCGHMVGNYCKWWRWNLKPSLSFQVSDPIHEGENWFIQPSYQRCAVCSEYLQRDTASQVQLEQRISATERDCVNQRNTSSTVIAMNASLDSMGTYKKQNCRHFQHECCQNYSWDQMPNSAIMIGKPFFRNLKYNINPTSYVCSACSEYRNKNEKNPT